MSTIVLYNLSVPSQGLTKEAITYLQTGEKPSKKAARKEIGPLDQTIERIRSEKEAIRTSFIQFAEIHAIPLEKRRYSLSALKELIIQAVLREGISFLEKTARKLQVRVTQGKKCASTHDLERRLASLKAHLQPTFNKMEERAIMNAALRCTKVFWTAVFMISLVGACFLLLRKC